MVQEMAASEDIRGKLARRAQPLQAFALLVRHNSNLPLYNSCVEQRRPRAASHRHFVLVEHNVVGEASVVDEGHGLALGNGQGGGLEHQGACKQVKDSRGS